MGQTDQLLRFIFENTHVRGELVQLSAVWQAALQRHDYPEPVRKLLGEALAVAVLLGASIKYQGSLILQIQGKGPMTLLVVQCHSNGNVRGTAEWNTVPDQNVTRLRDLFQEGRLAITIEQQGKKHQDKEHQYKEQQDKDHQYKAERYQGIVDLGEAGIATAIEGYFRQSEQLETRIQLASNHLLAAGLLLQVMPGTEQDIEQESDLWARVTQRSATLTPNDLLNIPVDKLLPYLYPEDDLRVFTPEPVSYRCNCSKERIAEVLRSLGRQEIQSILDEMKVVAVACEFCKLEYQFDAVDVEHLFASELKPSVTRKKH